MLTNASILKIDRQGEPNATGRPRRTTGSDVEIRCVTTMITGRQRYTLGAVLEDATQVVYVEHSALANAGEEPPANGDQLIVITDGTSTQYTVTVITTGDHLGPEGMGLSHIELFVRREPV